MMEFINELKIRYSKPEDVNKAISFIFEYVNRELKQGNFNNVDSLFTLVMVDMGEYSLDMLLSFLTITLPAESLLNNRKKILFRNRKKIYL